MSGGAPMEDAPLQRTMCLILREWDFGDLWGLQGSRKSRRPLISSRVVGASGHLPTQIGGVNIGNGD